MSRFLPILSIHHPRLGGSLALPKCADVWAARLPPLQRVQPRQSIQLKRQLLNPPQLPPIHKHQWWIGNYIDCPESQ